MLYLLARVMHSNLATSHDPAQMEMLNAFPLVKSQWASIAQFREVSSLSPPAPQKLLTCRSPYPQLVCENRVGAIHTYHGHWIIAILQRILSSSRLALGEHPLSEDVTLDALSAISLLDDPSPQTVSFSITAVPCALARRSFASSRRYGLVVHAATSPPSIVLIQMLKEYFDLRLEAVSAVLNQTNFLQSQDQICGVVRIFQHTITQCYNLFCSATSPGELPSLAARIGRLTSKAGTAGQAASPRHPHHLLLAVPFQCRVWIAGPDLFSCPPQTAWLFLKTLTSPLESSARHCCLFWRSSPHPAR